MAGMVATPPQVLLPVQLSGEVVAIPVSDLPHDHDDVLDLLSNEALPLSKWLEVAKAYLSRGSSENFLAILREATNEETLKEVERYFGRKPTLETIQCKCALACFYLELAREERDRAKRAELLRQATEAASSARALDTSEQLPYLVLGQLALIKGDSKQAMLDFRQADRHAHAGHRNIAGLLAQAQLHFAEGRPAEAFQLYCAALRAHPGAPAEVRLGLGAAAFRLGAVDRAEAAFARVLALDPANADALLGLATIRLGNGHGAQQSSAVVEGVQLLLRAHRSDPGHPGVLVGLSHCCLLRGDHQRALALARAAHDASDTDAQRAAALTLVGRSEHALGRLQQAQAAYAQASQRDARAPLPHLGLAQVLLARGGGDLRNAATELEGALAGAPGSPDALRLLAALYGQMPARVERALSHFQAAVQRSPTDAVLQEAVGELLARTDPAASLAAYRKALALRREEQQQQLADGTAATAEAAPTPPRLPARLLNNAALLFYRSGDVHEAVALMAEALDAMGAEAAAGGLAGLQQVTMGFNMARLQEAAGDVAKAKEGYKAILSQFPGYADCHLRLALLARNEGNAAAAQAAAEAAAAAAAPGGGGAVDAYALLVALHLERKDYGRAKEALDRLAALPDARRDAYVRLAQAALALARLGAPIRRSGAAGEVVDPAAVRASLLRTAQKLYKEVLTEQPSNIFAANGLGVVLAERGALEAAREAFVVVQEAAVASGGFLRVPDVYVNLANVALARGDAPSAITLYTTASKLHHGRNAQVLLYLSRAYYDANDSAGAKRALLRAVHVAPTDWKLRFNVALCLQEYAVRVFKAVRAKDDPNKLSEFQEAAWALTDAGRLFSHLAGLGKERCGIEPSKLAKHVAFCNAQLERSTALLERARLESAEAELRRRAQEAQLERADAERAMAALMTAEAEKQRRAVQQERARRVVADFEAKKASWRAEAIAAAEAGASKRAKGSKRRKGAAEEEGDGFIVDDSEALGRTAARRASESGDEAPPAIGGGGDAAAGSDLEDLFGGSDDEAGAGAADDAARATGGGGGRLRRSAAPGQGAENGDGDGGGGGGGDLEDDLFGDGGMEEDEAAAGPAAAGGGVEPPGSAAAPARKRQRLVDSDDEDGGRLAALLPGGSPQQQLHPDGGAGGEELTAGVADDDWLAPAAPGEGEGGAGFMDVEEDLF